MTIELTDDQRKQAVASLKRYAAEELDNPIGDLKAGLLLDFILAEIGPSVYNLAVGDAQAYLRDRLADLEATCFHEEFTYWPQALKAQAARAKGK
jgi:uncharacterized protein (DUF2164 family)